MLPETAKILPESDSEGLNFKETELTLGLPGESRAPKSGTKRGFKEVNRSENESTHKTKPPTTKAPVVGWPPVRTLRKKMMKSCKYVKVAVDGAPYLRKVDLETYTSYHQLFRSLEDMFTCFTIRNVSNERKLLDPVNGMEYVPTYEDKDGDWMLVGDVPWKMFAESCKRLRLMKSSEAIGLAPTTPPKCSSSSFVEQ